MASDNDIFRFLDKVFNWNNLVDNKVPVDLSNERKIWQAEVQHVRSSKGSDRCLAGYRLFIALAATAYFLLVLSLTRANYYNYLTNWGNTMMVVNFCTLTLGHALEGHYSCKKEPKPLSYSLQFWKISTLIY